MRTRVSKDAVPRVTSRDVARAAGVSRSTVSVVLSGARGARVSEATRQRVLAAARELGYTPNVLAQSLKTRKSRIIGLVVPSITNPFFPAIALGVEDVAIERDYGVFFCNSYRDPAKEREYAMALWQNQVEGAIFAGMQMETEYVRDLVRRGVAVVVFDRPAGDGVDAVRFDNLRGATLAAEHLLRRGRERIAFLSGPPRIRSRRERWEGFRRAMAAAGREIPPGLIMMGRTEREEQGSVYEIELGYSLTRSLIEDGREFDGIFAVNDMTAIGAIKALREARLDVPERVAVVGFDNLALASMVDPPLTTVAQPQYEMGMAAAELLFARLAGTAGRPAERVFQPELVVRAST